MKDSPKRIVLKLGGACNLKCKHCHASKAYYTLNEDIFDYLNKCKLDRITFSGGEPLLYFDTIKKIVSKLPRRMHYKMPTNGTLLTDDMVDYFNKHNFKIFFSYDGENNSRDHSYIQCWNELKKLKNHGLSTLFSADTIDSKKLLDEILDVREKYDLTYGEYVSVWANFPHQTVNNNEIITEDVVKEYCSFIANQLEIDMRKLKAGHTKGLGVLSTSFIKWIKEHSWDRGITCFNDNLYILAINGDFLLCPYDTITVGNIYTGVDWDKIESYIPDKCKTCPQWKSCGNTCIANVTDNECYISKVMYKHFHKLMNKYDITYEELDKVCKSFYIKEKSIWHKLVDFVNDTYTTIKGWFK